VQPALASPEVKVISRGKDYCFASWRQAYILEFRDTPSIEALDASVLGKREVYAANPQGVVVFNLVPGDRPLPSAEVREYAERKQGEDLAGVLAHATVVTGNGFRAGTFRSMLAGLYLVSRSSFPRKVFSNVDEAAAWQATILKTGRAWSTGLVEAVQLVQGVGLR
jgi:hypothetical protein